MCSAAQPFAAEMRQSYADVVYQGPQQALPCPLGMIRCSPKTGLFGPPTGLRCNCLSVAFFPRRAYCNELSGNRPSGALVTHPEQFSVVRRMASCYLFDQQNAAPKVLELRITRGSNALCQHRGTPRLPELA